MTKGAVHVDPYTSVTPAWLLLLLLLQRGNDWIKVASTNVFLEILYAYQANFKLLITDLNWFWPV